MPEESNKAFPMMPIKHWWTLRDRFEQSIPGVVTDNYLATVLNMKVPSARGNILPYLKQMGIIDEEGKPSDRAKKWRDDNQYPSVCEEIKKEIYPQEVLDAAPAPIADRASAENWFANHTGAGRVAVNKMVACYAVLCDADPAKAPKNKEKTVPKKKRPEDAKSTSKSSKVHEKPINTSQISSTKRVETQTKNEQGPDLRINLQIHISADASPDQIDQIFASMAKHIYNRKS